MRERKPPAIVWNPDAMLARWQRIEHLEQRVGARLLISLDTELETRVRRAPEAWYD
jgi:hypothetical protein